MKVLHYASCLLLILFTIGESRSQTFTMGNKCRENVAQANDILANDQFQQDLEAFDALTGDCKTKDGKETVQVGRAEALNGLGKYDDAIAASEAALKSSKNRSLAAHFQKAIALNKLGRIDESKESLNQVIQLTEMNQNTSERAQNYALMAALYDRQLHESDSAMMYMDQAITLNPENPDFYVQKGDMYAAAGHYNEAGAQYDAAMSHGLNELDGYIIKSETGLQAMEKKYGTTKAQELRDKMTADEKSRVCADLNKALELGWKDMNKDMFAALVCK